jgi:pimeloyl-ACP methyl ester carboxylesterase
MIVPGIMGSELVDAKSGRMIWGIRDPRWYVRAWATGTCLEELRLSEDEIAGRCDRVRAVGLLRFPAFAPLLRGVEPYTRLTRAIREVTVHPAAVQEFPYDWRLPIAYNAERLAQAARAHLARWRSHPALFQDGRESEANLVIVAHSMGGLLAARMTAIPGATEGIRRIITLGTPFYGSVKAAALLAAGRGVPLPRRRLQAIAATMPSIYDLLPAFRCVDAGTDAKHLTSYDIETIGGNRALAEEAVARRSGGVPDDWKHYVHVVGSNQPTMQSVTLTGGDLAAHQYTCCPVAGGGIERLDLAGDGTVPRQAAQLAGSQALPIAQSHGALAKSDETIILVTDSLLDATTGPWLGALDLGLGVPDVVLPGTPLRIEVRGADHPRDVTCRIIDTASARLVAVPVPIRADGTVLATAVLPGPGLFRVEVAGGGRSHVSELVLAEPGAETR